jgi:hypothetical protein
VAALAVAWLASFSGLGHCLVRNCCCFLRGSGDSCWLAMAMAMAMAMAVAVVVAVATASVWIARSGFVGYGRDRSVAGWG